MYPMKVYGGIDEAGKGPVIGPMAIAIVVADEDEMKKTGARDSKTLSQASRLRMGRLIMERAAYWNVKVIYSEDLNKKMEEMTINKIEENEVSEIIKNSPCNDFVVDSFDVNERRLSDLLSEMTAKNVICKHKADSLYVNVSAASILAKLKREEEMDRIRMEYGDVGSGYPSDPKTINFLKEAIKDGMDIKGIVRTHWKTYTGILDDFRQRKL